MENVMMFSLFQALDHMLVDDPQNDNYPLSPALDSPLFPDPNFGFDWNTSTTSEEDFFSRQNTDFPNTPFDGSAGPFGLEVAPHGFPFAPHAALHTPPLLGMQTTLQHAPHSSGNFVGFGDFGRDFAHVSHPDGNCNSPVTWEIVDGDVKVLAVHCQKFPTVPGKLGDSLLSSQKEVTEKLHQQHPSPAVQEHPLFPVLVRANTIMGVFRTSADSSPTTSTSSTPEYDTATKGFSFEKITRENTDTTHIRPPEKKRAKRGRPPGSTKKPKIPFANTNSAGHMDTETREVLEKEIFLLVDCTRLLAESTVKATPNTATAMQANRELVDAIKGASDRLIKEHEAYAFFERAANELREKMEKARTDIEAKKKEAIAMALKQKRTTEESHKARGTGVKKYTPPPAREVGKRGRKPKPKPVTETPYTAPEAVAEGKRSSFKPEVVKVLKEWLSRHTGHPYPTPDQKQVLADKTHLTIEQVNYWFINARRRYLPRMETQQMSHQMRSGREGVPTAVKVRDHHTDPPVGMTNPPRNAKKKAARRYYEGSDSE